jgi:glutathione S-transferase
MCHSPAAIARGERRVGLLVLYFSPWSSSLAVHIALNEIGAPFEARPVLVAAKETRQPEFLAINPEGKVPSLIVDGRLLTEVLAILFYLGEKYPAANLLPEDIEGKAQALSWMSFLASTVHGARADGEEARAAFHLAARRLGDRDWVLGDYSVADIFLFRLFWRFAARFKFTAGEFPTLEAHRARVLARPAVIKTLAAETEIAAKAGLTLA